MNALGLLQDAEGGEDAVEEYVHLPPDSLPTLGSPFFLFTEPG